MIVVVLAFVMSFLMCRIVLFTADANTILMDNQLDDIQKMHDKPVPRIGGAAIFTSLVFVSVYGATAAAKWSQFYSGLIISVFFVFIGGFTEDVSKRVTPLARLIFIISAVIFAVFVVHSMSLIRDLNHQTLNHLLTYDAVAFIITCFAVVGISNAYNMVDGYNGLSSMAAMLNVIGLFYLSYMLHDENSQLCCQVLLAAILGFFVFNYPRGKIFLGDGGSYVIGFLISLLSINLVESHRGDISPFSVLLLVAYPFTEAIFSIIRRKLIHKTSAMAPDNLHLHQLVFSRCLHKKLSLLQRNARVMPLLITMMIPQLFCVIFYYNNNNVMLLGLLIYFLYYIYVYVMLIKFKTPILLSLIAKPLIGKK